MTRHVAVAATGPVAVDAGLTAVRAGGNAVDAAIAAMCVAMTTEPGWSARWAVGSSPFGRPRGRNHRRQCRDAGPGPAEDRFGQGLRQFDPGLRRWHNDLRRLGIRGHPRSLVAHRNSRTTVAAAGAWAQTIEPAETAAREAIFGSARRPRAISP